MKILLIHNFYQQPGGEDTVFHAESSLLKKFGHNLILFVEKNVEISQVGRFKIVKETIWSKSTQKRLYSILVNEKPDIAHFHNTFNRISPAVYYACKKAGVPVVQTLHNYRLLCPNALLIRESSICEECINRPFPWPAIKYGCYRNSRSATITVSTMLILHRWLKTWQKKIDAYIALTDFSRRKFIAGGLPGEKIFVKPNFISPLMKKVDYHHGHALFVGRISSEKGILTLLAAWKKLKHIQLTIVGDGLLANQLQINEIDSISCKINWLGWKTKKEIYSIMQAMRFLIFPSECYETFGNTIIDAFACGLPVIASRLGAMAEIIQDGQTGLLFAPGNPDDLAAKVDWAWSHPYQMADMGKAARKEYEEKYTEERNYALLMQIYKKAIEINNLNK